jgi:hypothetical protein
MVSRRGKAIGGVILLVVVGLALSNSLSVLPSFEGMDMGVWGMSANSGATPLPITQNPSGFVWTSKDIHNAVLQIDGTSWAIVNVGNGQVEVSVSRPSPTSLPFATPETVGWSTPTSNADGSVTWTHVTGQINAYTVDVSVRSLDSGQENQQIFQGQQVWLQLQAETWNMAYQADVNGTSVPAQAWEAPLALYIQSYSLSNNPGQYDNIDPSYSGRFVTLYSAPGAYGTLDDLGFNGGNGNVNGTLSGSNPLAPDSRMRQSAYFPITLTKWGEDALWPLYSHYPVANYVLTLYTLQLGKYTYATPAGVQPNWTNPAPNGYDLLAAAWNWLSSPQTFVEALIVVVVVALVIVYIVIPGLRRQVPGKKA